MCPIGKSHFHNIPQPHELLAMLLLEDSSLKNAKDFIKHLLGLHVANLVCRETHTK